MNVKTFIDIPKLIFIYQKHDEMSFPITVQNYNYDTISFYIANIGNYTIYTGRLNNYIYYTYFIFSGCSVKWFTKSNYDQDDNNFSEKQWNRTNYQYYWFCIY